MTEAETKRVDVPVLRSLGPQSPWTPHNPWTVLGRGQAGALGRTSCGLDRALLSSDDRISTTGLYPKLFTSSFKIFHGVPATVEKGS